MCVYLQCAWLFDTQLAPSICFPAVAEYFRSHTCKLVSETAIAQCVKPSLMIYVFPRQATTCTWPRSMTMEPESIVRKTSCGLVYAKSRLASTHSKIELLIKLLIELHMLRCAQRL